MDLNDSGYSYLKSHLGNKMTLPSHSGKTPTTATVIFPHAEDAIFPHRISMPLIIFGKAKYKI